MITCDRRSNVSCSPCSLAAIALSRTGRVAGQNKKRTAEAVAHRRSSNLRKGHGGGDTRAKHGSSHDGTTRSNLIACIRVHMCPTLPCYSLGARSSHWDRTTCPSSNASIRTCSVTHTLPGIQRQRRLETQKIHKKNGPGFETKN